MSHLLRSPTVTPLPYTTLFRSRHGNHPVEYVRQQRARIRLPAERDDHDDRERDRVRQGDECGRAAAARDRKSTRLNSSHVESSYAVLCLKKKRYSTPRIREFCS